MMQFGNVVVATEYQEHAKMANWELIEVAYDNCSLCEEQRSCNIYLIEHTCQCLKCRDIKPFRQKAICGSCLGKWLKSRDMDIE